MIVSLRSSSGGIALLAGMFLPFCAQAQTGHVAAAVSQMELQGSDAGRTLADAMSTLATSPRNVDALIAAGEAALKLDDPRSAVGFFGRADDISPNNGRVKAGLGRSMLALGQVGDGLRLMEQASSLGYSDAALLADRGLARDLTGNQSGAQRDYLSALQSDPTNQTLIRRYAVSLGISGQVDQAEKTIEPLLYNNDRAAWRDRAFILAMNGRTPEALSITDRVMPKALADAIKPYMERMAMLTPGQRAAAVHLGQFPEGLVNVRVASTAIPVKPSPMVVAAEPAGKKAGGKESRKDRKQARSDTSGGKSPDQKSVAAPTPGSAATPTPSLAAARTAAPPALPPAAVRSTVVPAAPASSVARPVAATPLPAKTGTGSSGNMAPVPVAVSPSTQRPVQGPSLPASATSAAPAVKVATVPSQSPAAPPESKPLPQPVPMGVNARSVAGSPAAPGESTRSLADIMADIKVPEAEKRHDVVPVNLSEIAAMKAAERKAREATEAKARKEEARRKAEAEAKAKADAEKKRLADNPARYWVQIGAGRDTGALAFTLKRMQKDHSVLAKQDGWWADYGRTKRLVVGPFRSLDRAKAVEADMKKAGSDAFVWRSEAGEVVRPIGN